MSICISTYEYETARERERERESESERERERESERERERDHMTLKEIFIYKWKKIQRRYLHKKFPQEWERESAVTV